MEENSKKENDFGLKDSKGINNLDKRKREIKSGVGPQAAFQGPDRAVVERQGDDHPKEHRTTTTTPGKGWAA